MPLSQSRLPFLVPIPRLLRSSYRTTTTITTTISHPRSASGSTHPRGRDIWFFCLLYRNLELVPLLEFDKLDMGRTIEKRIMQDDRGNGGA